MAEGRIVPHPEYDNFTTDELDAEVKTIRDQIRLATEINDKELIGWKRTELGLCFAAMKRLNGGKASIKQAEFWPELITAKDALNLPEAKQDWILEDCLAAGSISILVAKPKTGKTFFAVNLALAVARGWPFLGRGVDRGPVGYLSLDAPLPDLMDVFRYFSLKEDDDVFMYAGQPPAQAIIWALEAIEKHHLRLLIVDTIQRMFKFENINDYSEVSNTLQPFLDKAQGAKCHVMFNHHAGKDATDDFDSAIGSSALRGLAYSYLHLKRLPESDQRIFRSDQRGGRNFDEIALSDGSDGWIEKIGSRMEAEINQTKIPILEFLKDDTTGATEAQIRLAVPVRGIIVSKALRELLKANSVERTGTGKRGNAFKYFVAGALVNEVEEQPNLIEVPLFGTWKD